MKIWGNRVFAVVVLLLNGYFIPFSIISIKNGSFGVVNIPIHLGIITALLVLRKKYAKNIFLLVLNIFVSVIYLFFLILLISTPILD